MKNWIKFLLPLVISTPIFALTVHTTGYNESEYNRIQMLINSGDYQQSIEVPPHQSQELDAKLQSDSMRFSFLKEGKEICREIVSADIIKKYLERGEVFEFHYYPDNTCRLFASL